MAVYRFEAEIGSDRRLTVPGEVPAGRAKILIIPEAQPFDWERAQSAICEIAAGPHHTKTKLQIDSYLKQERESWEE